MELNLVMDYNKVCQVPNIEKYASDFSFCSETENKFIIYILLFPFCFFVYVICFEGIDIFI